MTHRKKQARKGPVEVSDSVEGAENLTLGELPEAAGTLLAKFLPLDHAGIPGEKTVFLEYRTKVRVQLEKSPGYAQAYSSRLAGKTAAGSADKDVNFSLKSGGLQRLGSAGLPDDPGEVILKGSIVNRDRSVAGANPYAGESALSSACTPAVG